jgi:hypothetical protein
MEQNRNSNQNRTSSENDPEPESRQSPTRLTPSSAPNNSFDTGTGTENTGFDSPPVGSLSLSNTEVHDVDADEFPDELQSDLGESEEQR